MTNPEIDSYGNKRWYNKKGQYHRTDGPAIIYIDNAQYWYLSDGIYHDNKSFQEAANITDEDMLVIILKYGDVR